MEEEKIMPLFENYRDLGLRPLDMGKMSPRDRAELLYEYCISSDRKVSESVHHLFIIAEHYSSENPTELDNPAVINGIPAFFGSLTSAEKASYCYNQVSEILSLEAMPVTAESLSATRRKVPNDPWSSYAGRFVRRVTIYASVGIIILITLWQAGLFDDIRELRWAAFGCLGALLHLLNHALTTTRQQTFELSESRKIWPRLLLGGILGFVVPWLVQEMQQQNFNEVKATYSVLAFFAGYSVRFATNLLERLLQAVMPETKQKT